MFIILIYQPKLIRKKFIMKNVNDYELDGAAVDLYWQLVNVQNALKKPYDMPLRATKASQIETMRSLINYLFPVDKGNELYRVAFEILLHTTRYGLKEWLKRFDYDTPVNADTLERLINSYSKFPIVNDMITLDYENMDINDYYEKWYC